MSDLMPNLGDKDKLPILNDEDVRKFLLSCANHIHRSMAHNNEIEKIINRTFLITTNDINQIYGVITQRLANDRDRIEFMGFALSVVSTEENFRKYNAIEAFLSDVETRNIKPINVEMQWSVSIRFPDEDLASKQVIKIVITRPAYEIMGDNHADARLLLIYKNQPIVGNGAIIISVENTNKIWALDIMSHIENWLSKNVKKPSVDDKVKKSYASRNKTRMASRFFIEILPYFLGAGVSLRLVSHAKSVALTDSMLYFVFLCVSLLFAYQFVTRKYAGYLSDSIAKKLGGLMPRSVFIFSKEDQEKYEEYKASLTTNRKAVLKEIGVALLVNVASSILFVAFIETALKKAIIISP